MNTLNKREKEYPILRKEHAVGPVPDVLANGFQYSSVETSKYSIKLNARDSCVCVNGKIVIVYSKLLMFLLCSVHFGKQKTFLILLCLQIFLEYRQCMIWRFKLMLQN